LSGFGIKSLSAKQVVQIFDASQS